MKFTSIKFSYAPDRDVGIPLDSLTIPMIGAHMKSPIFVKSIVGLDPPEKTVFMSNSVDSGGYRQGSNVTPRQLGVLFGLQPDFKSGQTYSDLRDLLYEWMTPKLDLAIRFSLLNSQGQEILYTTGEFSKFEASIFSENPESQMTFECLDGYLHAPSFSFPDTQNMATFPIVVNNPGNAPSPFKLKGTWTGVSGGIGFYDANFRGLSFSLPMTVGDLIEINTTPGNKVARYTRSGITYNLSPYILSDSIWIQLHKGVNHIVPSSSLLSLTELVIYPRYWGV